MNLTGKPRVLLSLDFFPHYRAAVVAELLKSAENTWVLCGDDHDIWGSGVEPLAIPQIAEFHKTPAIRLTNKYAWMRGTLSLAVRGNYDVLVIHANWHLINTWFLALLGRLTRKRVVMFTIGWYRKNSLLERVMRRVYLRLGDCIALYGPWAREQALADGFSSERVFVVYNSLDVEAQRRRRERLTDDTVRRVRQELFSHPEWPVAVCTTRLLRKRRLELVLHAMKALVDEGTPINLLLVGEGPERNALEELAKDLGVTVCFYGPCYDEDRLAELIGSASVTVAPGMVGLTAMHSLGYGTPVVTHNDPWQQSPEWEVVQDGVNGSLFPFGDVIGLADAIKKWISPAYPTTERRNHCTETIERTWNPSHQRECFDLAVRGFNEK